MNMLGKPLAAIALSLITLATTSNADTYDQIDALALSLERQGNQVVRATEHYRNTPQYRYLVADARAICRLSDHIHDLACRHASLTHLEHDLDELNEQFFHLVGLFRQIERDAAYGHGQVQGDTRRVFRVLHEMQNTIYRLSDEIHSLRRASWRIPVAPQPRCGTQPYEAQIPIDPRPTRFGYGVSPTVYPRSIQTPIHDVHRSQYRPRGLTIGGGSSKFTIRF